MGKVAERSLCAEKMEGSDSASEEEQNGEELLHAEPHKKVDYEQSMTILTRKPQH